MTLKYMQGFETMRDDSDFRAQGWVFAPNARYVALTPSFTSVAGYSLSLLAAGNPANANGLGTSLATDVGYYNTGVTVNQAWLAGGFTMGVNARFNSQSVISHSVGAIGGAGTRNMCYDDVNKLYWAATVTGATYTWATSPDLVNWTNVSFPAGVGTGIAYMGGGVICASVSTSQTSVQVYWTNNSGITWNSQILGTNTTATGVNITGYASGNSAFPHVVYSTTLGSGNQKMWVGTLGGTMTQVVSASVANSGCAAALQLVGQGTSNPVFLSTDGNTASFNCAWSASASNASLNTAGAWNAITWSPYPGTTSDFAYNPVSNTYVLCCNNGIYTFPNSGAAGTPVAPTGAQTLTNRQSGTVYRLYWDSGTQTMIAWGNNGAIYTSKDSFTWTSIAPHINPLVSGYGNSFNVVYASNSALPGYAIFDGTQGVISYSPDGQTNYQARYVSDKAEATQGAYSPMGVFSATTSFTSGTFAGTTTVGMYPSTTLSAGNRTVTATYGLTSMGTFIAPQSPMNHYYEIVGTPVAATPNAFTFTFYMDGQVVLTSAVSIQMGTSTTDVTSVLGINLGRQGSWTQWDDIYFCTNDGQGISGPQGPINIAARRPTTNVQAQWVANGAATNSLATNQTALSSTTAKYVSSANIGDADKYTSTDAIPSGYRPIAVQVEGYAYRTSITIPSVNIGLSSSGHEVDTPTQVISNSTPGTAQFLVQSIDKDPNGNVAWTSASVTAAQFVVNHVS